MDARAVNTLLAATRPLVEVAEKTDALLRRRLGTAFRYADYAIRRSEVPLNRLLCDLLDPRGPHGQGGAFLALFLKTLKPDFSIGDPMAWRARHNFPTNQGRFIDIVIMGPKRTAVGMECKPWAEESEDQLEDYANCLLDRFEPERVWLLFLPGHPERIPETLSLRTKDRLSDRFVTLPFQRSDKGSSVVEWLEKCADVCEADKVARFLGDLAEYLDSEFAPPRWEQPMTDNPSLSAIVQLIGSNTEHIKSAFDIALAVPELRRQVAKNFIGLIKNDLAHKDWIVESTFANFSEGQNKEHLTYRKSHWPEGWGICLGQWRAMNDFYIGLYCPSRKSALTDADVGEIRNAIGRTLSAINNERSQKEWPSFTDLPEPFNNWTRPDTIALLKGLNNCNDGRSARESFVGWFQDLAAAAEGVIEQILKRTS